MISVSHATACHVSPRRKFGFVSKTGRRRSSSSGKTGKSTRNRWTPAPARPRSSSTRARPRPTACRIRATASPGRSRTSFPATAPCAAICCERKAGWDTHGLPVEVEVCKELGIHSKEEIEAYGVEPFIHKCLESVFRYTQQWEQLTERLGFWVNLDEAYVTYHQSYVESVWWALKNLFDRGLLYQGHKIVWWWAQGGTALSSGEVGQGYREVADPSVYVRFPLVEQAVRLGLDEDVSLLVWTTTPWTLPSNQFAAVQPDLEYAIVDDADGPREADHRRRPWSRRSPARSAGRYVSSERSAAAT